MNIFFFTSNTAPKDGWSVVGYNIIKNFSIHHVEVFSSEEKKLLWFGLQRFKSEMYQKLNLLVIAYDFVNAILKSDNKPDLIHCNVEHYAPVAMFLSMIYKVPYTITAHGTYGVLLPVKYPLYRKAFAKASKVFTVSQFTRNRMLEEKITANYAVIPNGVDKTRFKYNAQIIKENTLVFVGNLKARKGLKFLLDCMSQVNKKRPDIKLYIIGNINLSSDSALDILNFIKKNNINAEFTGKIEEEQLVNYYQKAKLNILPSQTEPFHFEGFGLIHVEANACGTLTIGTKNSGNEDAIMKKNGYLVNYGDTNMLTSIILDVFSLNKYPEIDINSINDWKDIAKTYQQNFERLIDENN